MERSRSFTTREISRWIDWFVRLFEPSVMAAIGLVIGRDRHSHVHADLRACREPEVSLGEAKSISSGEIEEAAPRPPPRGGGSSKILEAKLGLDPELSSPGSARRSRSRSCAWRAARCGAGLRRACPSARALRHGCALVRSEAGRGCG